MSDQCKHCKCMGDLKSCLNTSCFQHESWYAIEQQKLIKSLNQKITILCDELGEIREVLAGSECGEPVTCQEAYAVRICKEMYKK